jgi:regulator of nucleoside diphosphate kinase
MLGMSQTTLHRRAEGDERSILMVRGDHERLRALVAANRPADPRMRESFERLDEELERAVVLEPDVVPADVITLDSWARLLDLDTQRETLVSPVLPSKANADAGRISVLAPLGTAVLGYRAGDVIEWHVPGGLRRLHVLQVMYQPEAHVRRETAAEARRRKREARRAAASEGLQ